MWSPQAILTLFAPQCLPTVITGQACTPDAIAPPSIPGIEVIRLSADAIHKYTSPTLTSPATIDFCNVTVTYTHPGWNDSINVYIWLPMSNWNERLQGVGGGGFAGLMGFAGHELAIAQNYSVVGTDTGHEMCHLDASSWALDRSGKVDYGLLEDFAAVALNDAALIGKAIVKSYYGRAPKKSYWRGCSTGGRQGLMLAQRYPHAYDGIDTAAPAINMARFLIAEYWPQFVMNQLRSYPPQCVFDYINMATTAACDDIDGVKDGIISATKRCNFDPQTLVGQTVDCGEFITNVTCEAARIAAETWQGPKSRSDASMWYGLEPGAPFTGLANTVCTSSSDCTGNPFPISHSWITLFVLQSPTFDLSTLNLSTYESVYELSVSFYDDVISTNNPDLFEFKSAGGKMITWHGLADQLIPPAGTAHYYDRVEARDPNVRDYFRYFEAPGVEHCLFGAGPAPVDTLASVVRWVEDGIPPETLYAVSMDGTKERNLCPYPLVSAYKGDDPTLASSFVCQKSYQ